MPHIIAEYSDNLEPIVDIPNLLQELHEKLVSLGVDKSRLKTRAIKYNHYVVGDLGQQGKMIHVTLLLLEGRDVETKKSYGDALHQAMHDVVRAQCSDCKLTLEVRDMVSDTYFL